MNSRRVVLSHILHIVSATAFKHGAGTDVLSERAGFASDQDIVVIVSSRLVRACSGPKSRRLYPNASQRAI